MATFSTWSALRTAIKDAIATYIAGAPCTGEYTINGKTMRYRSIKELKDLYLMTYELEELESIGTASSRVSYSQYSRY